MQTPTGFTREIVACFGEALIDFRAEHGSDGTRHFVEQPGGAPANVAVGVAALGGRARFIGMLAQDMFGDALHAALATRDVDVSQVRRTADAPTALAFVALAEDGERSFSFYRPPAADLLFEDSDFVEDAFDDVAVLHVCSNSMTAPAIAATTLQAMVRAADAGALVSLDLNLRPALWPRDVDPAPTLWQALAAARLIKLSADELAFLTGDGDLAGTIARLFAGDAAVVLVTDGAAPMRWWTRTRAGTAGTFTVDAIDTTAAGDACVAGLLQRVVALGIDAEGLATAFEDDAVREDLLRHAAAAGALATTRHGAFDAMPDAASVHALLETAR
ncbi:carbohydrate kinase [Luteimonas fraxinea]|uniref:Carbohydrate kinase n=1 Tax=Luteimonas fraxinea TaxID=2901869 RepID=A0ABS8U6X4_9GAMM|nr:carbohydrate kinase [Luteimonas fraxinea]MCD9095473.1 carbohydrate kinase [Luteimonas fraxinea]MCD9126286.1 carbohydrate kinase [Luteimonas fraxinea]UHH11323.1 carbohydrate kinase [Luteimonas fraxinea]